jgi:hypothetical protein
MLARRCILEPCCSKVIKDTFVFNLKENIVSFDVYRSVSDIVRIILLDNARSYLCVPNCTPCEERLATSITSRVLKENFAKSFVEEDHSGCLTLAIAQGIHGRRLLG